MGGEGAGKGWKEDEGKRVGKGRREREIHWEES